MNIDHYDGLSLLMQGKAPGNREILNQITVGTDKLVNFIKQRYLAEYIALGGSKIKFVTGRHGSGKTHFLQLISCAAKEQGFAVVNFSAKDIWLHDFNSVYMEIFLKSNIMGCLEKCAAKIAAELGWDYSEVPDGMTFADHLSSKGEFNALAKKEIRNQLREMFLKNPLIDNNFAIACSLLTGGIMGHPVLESSNRELLLGWLSCSKEVKLVSLRGLGLSPARITKFNARHMLRSLSEVHRLASVSGIAVIIDDVDILVNPAYTDTVRYTKLKREDAYESIRELIDEIDTLSGIIFFYAFDRKLIDDELFGIKSYQALWLRIQNEIVSSRFNNFTDIIDLDRYAAEIFTKDMILDMSEKITAVINENQGSAQRVTDEAADLLLSKAAFTKTSLPRQVTLATIYAGYTEDMSGD